MRPPAGRAGCAACHLDSGPPQPGPRPNQAAFFIEIATNNGLDATVDVGDDGVGDVTGRAADKGRFKSPSLRNIAVTGPYMHDGRFSSIRQVLDHYNTQANSVIKNKISLTSSQKVDLTAFLLTLTDKKFLFNTEYSFPKEVLLKR